MADGTPIEWTDATWNIVTGCSIISPGCTNCYAMVLAGTRLRHHWSREGLTTDSKAGPVWNGKVRFNEQWLDQPLRWRRPRRVFVAAHGDLFHEAVPDEWIDRVFAVMSLAPQHTFQVLTKRGARMRDYFTVTGSNDDPDAVHQRILTAAYDLLGNKDRGEAERLRDLCEASETPLPLPNVWLGCSVEDQQRADERIPDLLATPAANRFLSCEPLLGPLDLTWLGHDFPEGGALNGLTGECWIEEWLDRDGQERRRRTVGQRPKIDWVIAGGESGPNARPMHPAWARELRDQCQAAGVPFFFKQWGEYREVDTDDLTVEGHPVIAYKFGDFIRVGKKAAGRLLDGREWSEFPA